MEARHTSTLQVSFPKASTNLALATASCMPKLRCGELCPIRSRKALSCYIAKLWLSVEKNNWGHSWELFLWESLESLPIGNTNVKKEILPCRTL